MKTLAFESLGMYKLKRQNTVNIKNINMKEKITNILY